MKRTSLFIFPILISLPAIASASIKICEINDPVTGNTPGCTQGSAIWGGGPDTVYPVKLYGDTIAHVVKRDNGWSSSCSISIDDNTYSISGNCNNYRIYANTQTHSLQVRRHISADNAWSNSDIDTIFNHVNSKMLSVDRSGDVKCPVSLQRSGSISTYSTGDGSIDSEAEVMALPPGIVHIVNDINWCNGGTSFKGCAWNGRIMVDDYYDAYDMAMTWAHEFGHYQGLGHTSGSYQIMTPNGSPDRDSLTWSECVTFREGN